MTRDDIIRLAHEAGFDSNPLCPVVARHSNGSWVGVLDKLCEFAELVAAAERKTATATPCEPLSKDDTVALWHAVNGLSDLVHTMRGMNFSPEQHEAERAKLAAARRALRKVNAIRKAKSRNDASSAALARMAQNDRMAERIAELEDELVREAARTAEYRLRVVQMTQRLDMCNRMKSAAEHEIAAAKGGA